MLAVGVHMLATTGVSAAQPVVVGTSSPLDYRDSPRSAKPADTYAPMLAAPAQYAGRTGAQSAAALLVTSRAPLTDRQRRLVAELRGVTGTQVLAAGRVALGRARVTAIAADVSVLRSWLPGPTSASDALWRLVADGAVASSFDAGKNIPLVLGRPVVVHAGAGRAVRSWVGALASTGLPGVDVVVNAAFGRQLQLTPAAMLLIQAPAAETESLRDKVAASLGSGATVEVLIHPVTPVASSAPQYLSPSQVGTIVRTALSKVGVPYVWGATGPDSFDCSGLVGFAYAAAGIHLPRVSEQMWLAGLHITPQAALPGDLLFWANDPAAPDDIDHVALYLGNGLMLSAPHTGAFVHVSGIPAAHFRGVVRVVLRPLR